MLTSTIRYLQSFCPMHCSSSMGEVGNHNYAVSCGLATSFTPLTWSFFSLSSPPTIPLSPPGSTSGRLGCAEGTPSAILAFHG